MVYIILIALTVWGAVYAIQWLDDPVVPLLAPSSPPPAQKAYIYMSGTSAIFDPPENNYAPAGLDKEFRELFGHDYYYDYVATTARDLDPSDIQSLLDGIRRHLDFAAVYGKGSFDCSEMSAYLEYFFERRGYATCIFGDENHAWVMIYNQIDDNWIPVECTSLWVPEGLQGLSWHADHSPPSDRCDSVGDAIDRNSSIWRSGWGEWDWWDTSHAATLESLS